MTALECFNEFETRQLYENFIHLKEDEVLTNLSIAFLFVTNLINVGSVFEETAKLHSTPVHIQTLDSGNRKEQFL